jgi:hypothetical protein
LSKNHGSPSWGFFELIAKVGDGGWSDDTKPQPILKRILGVLKRTYVGFNEIL